MRVGDIYLHVGPVKTGSTYLQDLLWTNRGSLARQGVLYPCEHDNEMWLAANDVQDGAFIPFDLPEAAGVWNRIRDRVLAFGGRAVLSHEMLGLSGADHVARIAASLPLTRVRIVVMARSLGATLPSLWQEKVKMADPPIGWPDFLEQQRMAGSPLTDASLIVQRWLRHVPASRIHVVTVPARASDRNLLLRRFAEVTGIDIAGWQGTDGHANESLDLVQSELLHRLNQVTSEFLDPRAQRRLNGRLLPLMRAADPARRRRLPAAARPWVAAETARRAAYLQHSGVIIHGDLAELQPPAEAWESAAPSITDADLLLEALRLLAESHPGCALQARP
jgi:hypothetical protein